MILLHKIKNAFAPNGAVEKKIRPGFLFKGKILVLTKTKPNQRRLKLSGDRLFPENKKIKIFFLTEARRGAVLIPQPPISFINIDLGMLNYLVGVPTLSPEEQAILETAVPHINGATTPDDLLSQLQNREEGLEGIPEPILTDLLAFVAVLAPHNLQAAVLTIPAFEISAAELPVSAFANVNLADVEIALNTPTSNEGLEALLSIGDCLGVEPSLDVYSAVSPAEVISAIVEQEPIAPEQAAEEETPALETLPAVTNQVQVVPAGVAVHAEILTLVATKAEIRAKNNELMAGLMQNAALADQAEAEFFRRLIPSQEVTPHEEV